jgi:hypothetical protein
VLLVDGQFDERGGTAWVEHQLDWLIGSRLDGGRQLEDRQAELLLAS